MRPSHQQQLKLQGKEDEVLCSAKCEHEIKEVIDQIFSQHFTALQVTTLETVSGPTYISDI